MNRLSTTIKHLSGLFLLSLVLASTATAEVRFGKNVRIGGHDVSNQTFTKNRRGTFYIYDKMPPNPGCRWIAHRDGSRAKVCHLKRKPR